MTEQRQNETCYVRSDPSPIPGMKRFSHDAMATTFEILIVHEDERYARQAAAAAFAEVDRLESELSRYIENSDVARINSLPAGEPLLLGLDTFECLKISARIYAETDGAFDITIGSLLQCWRKDDGTPRTPSAEDLELARQRTGTHLLQLDETEHTVELSVSPVQVDLGGIGKGFAVDRVAQLLREWSIKIALISGGYSSVLALEAPSGSDGWPLTLSHPANRGQILARPHLCRAALSGSGVQKGGHIISPRTGRPTSGKLAAWSGAPDAATADALSTAFMIMAPEEIRKYCSDHPDTRAMVIMNKREVEKDKILHFGTWKDSTCSA
ncbi:MAG: FAD:protein FMN transferase [Phycisphaerales bacterium]|nr:MAG: FAD:protein FMN transferase [Phycisphaerales bacterium]